MFNMSHFNGLSYFEEPFKLIEVVFIILVAGSLSLVTIIGNILVMLSIKVNKNLQTINNYFIFSLACADLIIGLCSMNLYTAYIVTGYWPMGLLVCDLWLALDYVVSNASVMNLLIISFDRYFCVTQPLSYPIKRTTKMAGLMIAAAWILSFILWAPAILFWQFIVGVRTVPERECYIQFFSNATVTFGTAIAAFYLPVTIMIVLYWQISKASKSRVKTQKQNSLVKAWVSNHVHNHPAKHHNTYQNAVQSASQEKYNTCDSQCHNGKHPFEMDGEDNGHMEDEKIDSCVPDEGKESSNHPTYISKVASDLKDEEDALPRTAIKVNSSQIVSCSLGLAESELSGHNADTCSVTSTNEEITQEVEQQRHATECISEKTKQSPRKRKSAPQRERKVTRTIMAILVAFVVTWAPYNVMVLINTLYSSYIPNTVWIIGYWLCYVNSTVNPACYALCNGTFKKTFKNLLLCQYKNIRQSR